MTGAKQRFIKVYRGDDPTSRGKYIKDLDIQKNLGYIPMSESWSPGSHGIGSFIIAIICIPILGVGLVALIYMLIVKPKGMLTVIYELENTAIEIEPT